MYVSSAVLQLVTTYAVEIFVAVMIKDVLVCIGTEKIILCIKTYYSFCWNNGTNFFKDYTDFLMVSYIML